MGPALKDGKEILDTFKNYFGKDDDMSKMLSILKHKLYNKKSCYRIYKFK